VYYDCNQLKIIVHKIYELLFKINRYGEIIWIRN
jgi:hypothetical protein